MHRQVRLILRHLASQELAQKMFVFGSVLFVEVHDRWTLFELVDHCDHL